MRIPRLSPLRCEIVTDAGERRGFALVLSILAVVVAGALIVATHVAVNLEHIVAAASLDRQRAYAAAEYGLWSAVAGGAAPDSALRPGEASTKIIRVERDSVTVTTVRLSERMYWITAEAIAGAAVRRSGMNVRIVVDSTGGRAEQVTRSWTELY